MCARTALLAEVGDLVAEYHLGKVCEYEPHYNLAPTMELPIVVQGPEGRELICARWGLVTPRRPAPIINVRSETALSRFSRLMRETRCIVPVSGFFEWRQERGVKQPYLIRPVRGGTFGMAGVYENGADGLRRCAILTTEPNELVEPIHDRMPSILSADTVDVWLEATDAGEALAVARSPLPSDQMAMHPVTRRMSRAAYDEPDAVVPEAQGGLF